MHRSRCPRRQARCSSAPSTTRPSCNRALVSARVVTPRFTVQISTHTCGIDGAMPMKRIFLRMLLATLSMGVASLETTRAADPATNSTLEVSVTPEATFTKVSGNTQKFREDVGIRDGWTGGIEDMTLHEDISKDITLDGEGRFILDDHDYKLQLQLTKKDVGFVRAGFTEYRE